MVKKDTKLDHIARPTHSLITPEEQKEMSEWLQRTDDRIFGFESGIRGIYNQIIALEQKGPYLTRKEAKELEQKISRMFDWAKKVSQKTGIALPKL